MAHKYKKTARRLQKHWGVSYSTVLRAAIDTRAAPDWDERYETAKKANPYKSYKDIHFDLCVEDWAFN